MQPVWALGADLFQNPCSHLYQTGTAFTTTALQFAVITHSRRRHITTDLARSIQDRCSGRHFNGDVVDGYFK
jgi:hypothetical protein